MTGSLTSVCLKEVGNRTAAAVDDGMDGAPCLPGVPLQDIGKGDRVVIKPHTFQREPGLRRRPELPAPAARASARGAEVLIAERTQVFKELLNALYEQREAGVYLEDFPPQAIRTAGIRYSMGHDVTDQERTRFRVPPRLSDNSRPLSWSAPEELV